MSNKVITLRVAERLVPKETYNACRDFANTANLCMQESDKYAANALASQNAAAASQAAAAASETTAVAAAVNATQKSDHVDQVYEDIEELVNQSGSTPIEVGTDFETVLNNALLFDTDDTVSGTAESAVIKFRDIDGVVHKILPKTTAENITGLDDAMSSLDNRVLVLETSFPAGCSRISSAIAAYGVTPASNSPAHLASAVDTLATNMYTAGQNNIRNNPLDTGTATTVATSGTNAQVSGMTVGYYGSSSKLNVALSKFGAVSAANVLKDQTFTSSAGVAVKGTMTNKGNTATAATAAWDSSNSRVKMTIPATGYYDTSSTLYSAGTNFGDAAQANVLTGKSFTSSAGLKKSGTMANNGVVSVATTAGTGNQTVTFGTAGYTTGVKIDRTAAYNAGKSAAIVSLGTNTSFTVTSYSGYKNFTVANFIVEPEDIAEWKHGDDHMSGDWHFGSGGSLTLTKSYNASTGVLTAYTTMTTFKTTNGTPSDRGSTTGKVKAYLWLK